MSGQGRWFRVYDALVDDPKVQRLTADMFKALVNIWCLASQNGGVLPSAEDIAFKLRMPAAKVETIVATLQTAGLLDADETGLRPHNWEGRQFKSDVTDPTAATRMKRYRHRNADRNGERNADRNGDGPLIRPDTETETDIPKPNGLGRVDVSKPTAEAELFDRGKAVLGASAGGLIRNLLKAKGGNIALARAAIEQASTKQSPKEFIGRIVSGTPPADHAGAVQTVAL